MSSLLDFVDFGSTFFGQPDKQRIKRQEYLTQNVDYYKQGLESTGIKVTDPERWSDIEEDKKRKVDITKVGVTEDDGDQDLTATDLANLSGGVSNALSSSSSLEAINASFIDYNTSLQNAGFKDRSQSFLSKNFGISLAAPQSVKDVKQDIKSITAERVAKSVGKKALGLFGFNPIATNVLGAFAPVTTVQDPLGNPSGRPSHAVMGTVMDVNFSIQSNNISQSIAAMNANAEIEYGQQKSPTGFFGYIGGQLVSRAPNGRTYTGVNAEHGRMAEAYSKGYAPMGYNVDTEVGTTSIAVSTGGFRGYTEKGAIAYGYETARAGTMKDVEATASKYGITNKQVISALEKVRGQYTFFGNLKSNIKNPVTLSQALTTEASRGAVGSTGDLGGATGAGYSTPENVASASSFDDGSTSPSGDSSSMGEDSSGQGYATAKGGKVGNGFALGGRGTAEPAGFIGGPPENYSDQTTIADDIPLKVKDGTFIINAPAVEYAGSIDIQKMLAEGYQKAMTRDIGVDKNFRVGKIPSREELDIQISRGEVVVPPHVAKAIGYDRLEKINNRGKREVERRQKAGNQEKVQAGEGFAAKGGNFTTFTIDKVADAYKEKYPSATVARNQIKKLTRKMPLEDALAILIWGEAKTLGDEGLEGAAHVLMNRANAEKYPGFGKDIYDEITRTYKGLKGERIFEFNALEPTKFRETVQRFKQDPKTYARVRNIAEEVMAGARKDFTNNALFFWNPNTSGSDWYKNKVARKEFKETYRTVSPKNKKTLHVYHVPSDFKMDTFLKEQNVTPEQFNNEIPKPKMRPEEDRSDDGGGFIDYLRKLF